MSVWGGRGGGGGGGVNVKGIQTLFPFGPQKIAGYQGGPYNMLARKANRDDPDMTACSEAF